MKSEMPFKVVLPLFQKENIPFLLIGGFSVNFYKYTRNTNDVDFMVSEKKKDFILSLLSSNGFKEYYSGEAFSRFESENMLDVDLMYVDQATFDQIYWKFSASTPSIRRGVRTLNC